MTSRTFADSGDLENQQQQHHMSSTIPPSSSNSSDSSTLPKTDFSFSILWSPLPLITWIIPFIGHMGIADSRGYSHDFQGPYYVGTNRKAVMAFGPTTRYLKMDIGQLTSAERWDEAIQEADRVYCGRMHSACTETRYRNVCCAVARISHTFLLTTDICCDNCHSHVCLALNRMPLEAYGIKKWDMVKLCFLIFFRGSFISFGGFLCQFLPFGLLVGLILLFSHLV